MAAHPDWVAVGTLLPGLRPEQLIYESWVQKESRYRIEWRPRWLILYRDSETRLPVLSTFKDARCDWDWTSNRYPSRVPGPTGSAGTPDTSTRSSPAGTQREGYSSGFSARRVHRVRRAQS